MTTSTFYVRQPRTQIVASLILLLALMATQPTIAQSPPFAANVAKNVILVTTDGLRWQELFTGAEDRLIDKEIGQVEDPDALRQQFGGESAESRRQKLMPFFWEVVAKQGVVFGNPAVGSRIVCSNQQWFSYPGYQELLCGFPDLAIDSNDPIPNKNVSVLEWLHRRPEFSGRVAAFASWDRFEAILNRHRSGLYINDGWQPFDVWSDAKERDMFNTASKQLPHYWLTVRFDAVTFRGAMEYLQQQKPRVFYLSLGETDDWCHAGRYDLYLHAARNVDDQLRELWTTLQSMPEYRDQTAVLMTTDHGRGTGPEDWKSHGTQIAGSDQMWAAAWGKGVSSRGVVPDFEGTQAQTAATVAALLGLNLQTFDPRVAPPLPVTDK